MDSESLLNKLSQTYLASLKRHFQEGDSLLIEELWEGAKTIVAAIAHTETKKHLLIVTTHTHWLEDLVLFLKNKPLEFPSWDTLPSENKAPSLDITGERFRVLKSLKETKGPKVIVTSFQAVLEKVIAPQTFERNHLILKKSDVIPFKDLASVFESLGYQRKSTASDKGEYALRGGIVDIFPPTSLEPFRIEFEEDEIISLRFYDPISQLSQKKVEEALITPANEIKFLENEQDATTLLEYLGPNTLIVFDDLLALEDHFVLFQESMEGQLPKNFLSLKDFFSSIAKLQKLYLTNSPLEELSEVKVIDKNQINPYSETASAQKIVFSAFNQELSSLRFRHHFYPLFPTFCPREVELENFSSDDFLKTILNFPIDIEFLSSTPSEESHLKEKIQGITSQAKLTFSQGYLTSGFFLKETPESPAFALVPMCELTHRYKVHRTKQRTHYHGMAHDVFSLSSGEFVVHMQSGIGRFLGIEKRPNHIGIETEFLLLEYADGAKLYVPMDQAKDITKYIGTSEETPELHTLGSSRWKSLREKTERAIVDYAQDLLELQAERLLKEGFIYPPHSDLVKQFSEEFPYVETPDQREAITKVYEDMMSKRPMDRLICGDVGYGKTEVAMRAAFKAVVDGGKQVAVLVPTTVLASQHYESFLARMDNFSVKVGLLCRFKTAKEIKETLKEVSLGKIDILIGTHRIVSEDVLFKDLGLVIIDEEQRFGVKAKEHLKKIKKEVDCLTLSATPIPRTLYLSLVGARDMSSINTPPEDRLPIQSVIAQNSDDLLKSTLLRELARDGQAYVIHNRVETIYGMADKIRSLLPGARVIVGHGQMHADELDTVFHTFKSGKADILVATSIIENGIDIPNANTILIDRADRFGMADLYQMRGRVGRWNKKAYCYFLVPNLRDLSGISRKRLSALVESSGYGGGMKIAMRDLEIRGAGNILGMEQSGHITTIGFHLYCKLLKKAMNALKKKRGLVFTGNLKIEFPFDARLPENYVNETSLRMEIYQRLGDAEEEAEIDTLKEELKDRFGPFPPQVDWLFAIAKIRFFAEPRQFSLLRLSKGTLLAVQTFDKKKSIERTFAFPLPKTPQDLQEKVILALKEHFYLPDT